MHASRISELSYEVDQLNAEVFVNMVVACKLWSESLYTSEYRGLAKRDITQSAQELYEEVRLCCCVCLSCGLRAAGNVVSLMRAAFRCLDTASRAGNGARSSLGSW
jgi:hypothetical protein